jgi:hypothetical protein
MPYLWNSHLRILGRLMCHQKRGLTDEGRCWANQSSHPAANIDMQCTCIRPLLRNATKALEIPKQTVHVYFVSNWLLWHRGVRNFMRARGKPEDHITKFLKYRSQIIQYLVAIRDPALLKTSLEVTSVSQDYTTRSRGLSLVLMSRRTTNGFHFHKDFAVL